MLTLPRKNHDVVMAALDSWVASGDLDSTTASHLKEVTSPLGFDWGRMGRYVLWIALTSLFIGISALMGLDVVRDFYLWLWSLGPLAPTLFWALIAGLLYFWAARQRKTQSYRWLTNEGILFIAVLATAAAVAQLAFAMATDFQPSTSFVSISYGNLSISEPESTKGFDHLTLLFGLAALIYGVIGLWLNSKLVWIFAILTLGSWMGAETGYASGWGAYWMGMNYPMRFILFGGVLVAASFVMEQHPRLAIFERCTRSLGLLYSFISLWIVSIFGNYGDMYGAWYKAAPMELFHWSILFAAAAGVALWFGVKRDDAMLRGYGIVFLGINLYTRFFEHFWNSMHASVFFLILGLSLWFFALRIETIWNLGRAPKKTDEEHQS